MAIIFGDNEGLRKLVCMVNSPTKKGFSGRGMGSLYNLIEVYGKKATVGEVYRKIDKKYKRKLI